VSNYFEELEKIANDLTLVDDLAAEPMVPDYAPQIPPEEVEAIQANQPDMVDTEAGMEGQEPVSQEDIEAYDQAIEQAQMQLESAKETLASAMEEYNAFEKTAQELNDALPTMGALAKLIEYSTSETIDDDLRKQASDRLVMALESEESFVEVMDKTANELFEDQEDKDALYSPEGREYVIERLALFAEDEELEKTAADLGGFVNDARKWAAESLDAARKFHKLRADVKQTQAEVDRLESIMKEKVNALKDAQSLNDDDLVAKLEPEAFGARDDHTRMKGQLLDEQIQRDRGRNLLIGGATGLVGGSLFAGKKIADAFNNHGENQGENELAEKTASDTIKQDYVFKEGGNINMAESIVKDFLKIAGAAVLLDVANDEGAEEAIRKEAAEAFNGIARMGRKDMEEALVKVATQMYSEDQLHEIVSGKHNEELFGKVAFFTSLNDLSVDELEKVAAAESVAAKGVGGALTDAKSNIEAKVEGDKKKTETVANGEIGTKKADDMRGYNVINSPGEYKVEKTAATQTMLEEAELRKEAAYKAFVEADTFIKNNSK
jgi:hypothetical protein